MSVKLRRESGARERGQVVVFFALLIPVLFALSGVVVGLGNWFVHARHLQTKADSGALAGGTAWSFPCDASGGTDASIINTARAYAGSTNPQVGKVPDASVHSVLNGPQYYDDDSQPVPAEFTSPAGSVCDARILDVKLTEDNSFPLASLIPIFPDIKRKARVEIQEGAGTSGLLPIAVRVPKPLSAAAIYIDERPGTFGNVLETHYFNDICEPPGFSDCIGSIPTALDQWRTEVGLGGNAADISGMSGPVGVVIGFSFRPQCPATRCFDIDFTNPLLDTADEICNQGTGAGIVKCYYTTESGGTQTVRSGLQFIRTYGPADPDPAPDVLGAWIDAPISGTNCSQGYFSAPVSSPCDVTLFVEVDPGAAASGGTFDIRYKLVSGDTSWQEDDAPGTCNANFGANCTLSAGSTGQINIQLDEAYARHAVAIQVRLGNIPLPLPPGFPPQCANPPSNACSWYFTSAQRTFLAAPNNPTIFANPIQRGFMGDIDSSGPVKFLHMYRLDCNTPTTILAGVVNTADAASAPAGQNCFKLEMGLQGALARAQDEEPIVLNIGATSQSSVLDCDPDIPNLKDEIVQGCGAPDQFPTYMAHDFAQTPYCPSWNGINQFFSLPKPSPWQNWAPFTCVVTQTSASANQVMQGLNERFFGVSNNPVCPADNAAFVSGRNYWHDENNNSVYDPPDTTPPDPGDGQFDWFTFADPTRGHPNKLRNDDPRFVLLFVTPYNSFTGNGNEIYPITLIGGFYITGYGRLNGSGGWQGGAPEDPCTTGNGLAVGAGNTPPSDLDYSNNGAVAWGHFVTPVNLGTSSGGTGELCQPATLTRCVVVLVE